MSENFEKIVRLTHERQRLWSKAGHGGLKSDEINRVQQITAELADTWDSYRREIAGGRRATPDSTVPNRNAA